MRRGFLHLTLLLALAASLACDKPHVLVVGLDGANWAVLDPLIHAGHLPNIGPLVTDGARGAMHCAPAHPATACFCPPVWTSIATGVPFSRHRIGGLYTPSSDRSVKAIWNVVQEYGGSSTTVSFRGTWPPEPDVDWVFSEPGLDAAGDAHFATWGTEDHPGHHEPFPLFEPPDLLSMLALDPPPSAGADAWWIHARDRIAMEGLLRLEILRGSADGFERQTELTMIVLHGPDKVAHVAWGQIQNVMYGRIHTDPLLADAESWQGPVLLPGPFGWGPIAGPYLEADAWLGELLAVHPYDYVVFVSDHGMTRNPNPGLSGHHNRDAVEAHTGIFAINGPGVRPGWIGVMTVLDVVPTLAYVLGLPLAQDLPGRVLTKAFEPSFLQLDPPFDDIVPSWE